MKGQMLVTLFITFVACLTIKVYGYLITFHALLKGNCVHKGGVLKDRGDSYLRIKMLTEGYISRILEEANSDAHL